MWLVLAAAGSTLIGYRFYARFIAAKVMALDDRRATPAERLRNGHDFEPTNKWIVFGHHFAAIAGPGPLVGPDAGRAVRLSAGNAVDHHRRGARRRRAGFHHPVLPRCGATASRSGRWRARRSARSGGFTALLTVLLIMIILLAVIALVVVNALRDSPWGTFTIAATMPIAVFMGLYLRYWRPGKVLEVLGDRLRAGDAEHLRRAVRCRTSPSLAPMFTLSGDHAGDRDHHLRVPGERTAGVAAACAARLPEHVRKAWRGDACSPSAFCSSGPICNCRPSRVSSMARADLRGQNLSVLLHHHRLRRDLRVSRADLVRHDAEDDCARVACLAGRLRIDGCSKALSRSWR